LPTNVSFHRTPEAKGTRKRNLPIGDSTENRKVERSARGSNQPFEALGAHVDGIRHFDIIAANSNTSSAMGDGIFTLRSSSSGEEGKRWQQRRGKEW
jgi:hypothetical protein